MPHDIAPLTDEMLFRELADNAPVMIWRSGTDKLCNWFNKPWLDFVGRTMEQEVGNGWAEGVHKDDFDHCLNTYVGAFDAQQPFSMIYRLRRHDGEFRYILDNGAPFSRSGEFAGYFGSCIDITEQRELEAQLSQAQKMEALGQLTGGIAHDFNNILQVLAGCLQLLTKDVAGHARAEERVRNALSAVQRGSKLASQLLAYGRRQVLSPRVVNLGRLIQEMDNMLRRALGEGVEIETVIATGLWNTSVDPVQMETALLNLAVNARDAMRGQGKLTIEARNASIPNDYAAQQFGVAPGQYVMVAVTDTGCGMAPDIAQRVFDPFFTTKPEGEGTGLGLSMVQGFVRQSNGHIKIYSEVGHGTTIRLYLPRTKQKEDIRPEQAEEAPVGGVETVLVVEDDEQVRGIAVELLRELGYGVLTAKNADAALPIIESGARIDVLFSDIVMPGQLKSGELARLAKQRLPRLVVLFTSGYAENAVQHGGRVEDGVEILRKPYTREELARALRRVLR